MWVWRWDSGNKPEWPPTACEETLIRIFLIYNFAVFLGVHFESSVFTCCQCVLDRKSPGLQKEKKNSNRIVVTHLGLFRCNISYEQQAWLSVFYFFFFFLWHCGLRPWLQRLFHFPNRPWSNPHSSFHRVGRLGCMLQTLFFNCHTIKLL